MLRIVIFLEELSGDQNALNALATDKYEEEEFNVAGIKSWWKNFLPAFRIRLLKIAPDHRLFYAAVGEIWVVLGVEKRRADLYDDVDLQAKLRGRLDGFKGK